MRPVVKEWPSLSMFEGLKGSNDVGSCKLPIGFMLYVIQKGQNPGGKYGTLSEFLLIPRSLRDMPIHVSLSSQFHPFWGNEPKPFLWPWLAPFRMGGSLKRAKFQAYSWNRFKQKYFTAQDGTFSSAPLLNHSDVVKKPSSVTKLVLDLAMYCYSHVCFYQLLVPHSLWREACCCKLDDLVLIAIKRGAWTQPLHTQKNSSHFTLIWWWNHVWL